MSKASVRGGGGADPRSKRSQKLLYTWLQAARKVGTTEHGGFNFVLKYDALRNYENSGRHTLRLFSVKLIVGVESASSALR